MRKDLVEAKKKKGDWKTWFQLNNQINGEFFFGVFVILASEGGEWWGEVGKEWKEEEEKEKSNWKVNKTQNISYVVDLHLNETNPSVITVYWVKHNRLQKGKTCEGFLFVCVC